MRKLTEGNIWKNFILFAIPLVLSGLLGIHPKGDSFTVKPLIPDNWDYFKVENLWLHGKCFTITYDKDGSHYGESAGLTIKGE